MINKCKNLEEETKKDIKRKNGLRKEEGRKTEK